VLARPIPPDAQVSPATHPCSAESADEFADELRANSCARRAGTDQRSLKGRH